MGLAIASLAAAATVSVRDVYNGTLDLNTQVEVFRHIDRLFPSAVVRHGSAHPLPAHPRPLTSLSFSSGRRTITLDQYLEWNRATGLLVLHDGKIALERHRLGNDRSSRWVSWSIAKSITSTLLGAAIQDGSIRSLDDPVTKYVPQLRGSGYEGASVRNVVQMTSGVRWDETYTDPSSDRRQMLDAQLRQRAGGVLDFLRTRPRAAPPGSVWNYSTGETHVLGAVVRAAVRKPLAAYLAEKIWVPFGMEADATWWLDAPDGLEVGGSGFSATLRDYGRFALFVLGGGKAGGRQVVPANWFPDAGQPKRVGNRTVPYGYMWWSFGAGSNPVHTRAFYGLGIFGQYLYINPDRNIAIVVWSARQTPGGSTRVSDVDFFTAVVTALGR